MSQNIPNGAPAEPAPPSSEAPAALDRTPVTVPVVASVLWDKGLATATCLGCGDVDSECFCQLGLLTPLSRSVGSAVAAFTTMALIANHFAYIPMGEQLPWLVAVAGGALAAGLAIGFNLNPKQTVKATFCNKCAPKWKRRAWWQVLSGLLVLGLPILGFWLLNHPWGWLLGTLPTALIHMRLNRDVALMETKNPVGLAIKMPTYWKQIIEGEQPALIRQSGA